ncbi:hypothetical protein [Microbulbifer sp. MCCC 1A16149]|uniref:hypothetical protein n=1 Tax=Microbulbifer sp. MCCC 1A16149 TaxID=3411322 RepID=UPI003D138DC7
MGGRQYKGVKPLTGKNDAENAKNSSAFEKAKSRADSYKHDPALLSWTLKSLKTDIDKFLACEAGTV